MIGIFLPLRSFIVEKTAIEKSFSIQRYNGRGHGCGFDIDWFFVQAVTIPHL
jgi:hypothetical protein